MKNFFSIIFIYSLCVLLCACPYSSPFKLDDTPVLNVEEGLLGKWAAFITKEGSASAEPVKLILSKRNETEYNIAFTGSLNELRSYHIVKSDSITGTAFLSAVADKLFLNITVSAKVYIAEVKLKDNKLSLLPLSEHFTGKMIFNNTALRNSVEFHCRTRVHPMYDEDFCLKDMIRVN